MSQNMLEVRIHTKRQSTLVTAAKLSKADQESLQGWVLQANSTLADEKKCGFMVKDLFAEMCARTSGSMLPHEHLQTEL